MKVVTPDWLLESVRAGTLLPWRQFAIGAASRSDESQGMATQHPSIGSEIINGQQDHPTITDPSQARDTAASSVKHEATPLTTNVLPSKEPSNTRSLHGTDPATKEEAPRIPSYAAHRSNPHAKRKMEDPHWRAAHTAVAPGFIEGYYRNSRLHHLSTWKAELQDLVAKAVERVEKGEAPEKLVPESSEGVSSGTSMHGVSFSKPTSPQKGKGSVRERQVIMHCDFDSFFVSAGLVDRPHLKDKPVVVCHSQGEQGGGASTSEIASSSYEARKFGIKNGMRCATFRQLKKLFMDTLQPWSGQETLSERTHDTLRIRAVCSLRLSSCHSIAHSLQI